ncbi:MAG: tRNA (guanosine(46)-N7)-methyltransferase TrmB [Candidatus Symbiobacter sp.]|nr:tRNA (guanosine(46)-N7)-methyltransferase TrmB [Candidatus Symbiobacter sp.]
MNDASAAAPRFYGRRKSHKLRQHQQELYDTLLPRLRLRVDHLATGGIAAAFAGDAPRPVPYRDYWLEIGFGGGEHMVGQATAAPDIGIMGCDMFINGIAQALRPIEQGQIANIRLYEGDARRLLALLPAHSLAKIFILFPDPWPKKRHHRRRIINPAVMDALAFVLKPGGELRLATDDLSYLPAMLRVTLGHRAFHWTARQASDWQTPPPGWVPTRYQKKAEKAGRVPYFLNFTRV